MKRPHRDATAQSISRWIKQVLAKSGVDVSIFSAHSTRHAATSTAAAAGVSIDVIRKTAGWTATSQTFAKFYNRSIIDEKGQEEREWVERRALSGSPAGRGDVGEGVSTEGRDRGCRQTKCGSDPGGSRSSGSVPVREDSVGLQGRVEPLPIDAEVITIPDDEVEQPNLPAQPRVPPCEGGRGGPTRKRSLLASLSRLLLRSLLKKAELVHLMRRQPHPGNFRSGLGASLCPPPARSPRLQVKKIEGKRIKRQGATPDGVVGADAIIEITCPITAFKTSLDEAIENKKEGKGAEVFAHMVAGEVVVRPPRLSPRAALLYLGMNVVVAVAAFVLVVVAEVPVSAQAAPLPQQS
ncbi:hypothetical protein MSG28_009058 [Choristoneura fumiferana]|uniref:Uncharacterized protein n=1 Tax=Choristoneura fumiferana TaxID=7141 RepID=A0ACC0KWM9_CHOFU|nr:hypothetical protein MSG28_009058 [Choristoneura fumiferana]